MVDLWRRLWRAEPTAIFGVATLAAVSSNINVPIENRSLPSHIACVACVSHFLLVFCGCDREVLKGTASTWVVCVGHRLQTTEYSQTHACRTASWRRYASRRLFHCLRLSFSLGLCHICCAHSCRSMISEILGLRGKKVGQGVREASHSITWLTVSCGLNGKTPV